MATNERTTDRSAAADAPNERNRRKTNDSIKHYVNNILLKHPQADQSTTNIDQTRINILTDEQIASRYENLSAFRRYQPSQKEQRQSPTRSSTDENDDEQNPDETSTTIDGSLADLNLDPDPIVEERPSEEQIYRQKVYLRQLQPPTPQPVEIQVQEVLIPPPPAKPPIHVRVGQREQRTPSPILIKTAPPPPPTSQSTDEPIVYTKYLPPPKQPPRQIVIHRYPDLPPKPRPIVVEQWLPYKPAPKRIIKQSLPREALKTPPPPHNIIVSYAKPRALIEVELVRLPVVKIDPQVYQQMSSRGQEQLSQYPMFQHEQTYLRTNNPPQQTSPSNNDLDWRI